MGSGHRSGRGQAAAQDLADRVFSNLAKRYELVELPLDVRIACAAAALPAIHRDPFDRVLVALAGDRALTILTSDENIPKYPGVRTIW